MNTVMIIMEKRALPLWIREKLRWETMGPLLFVGADIQKQKKNKQPKNKPVKTKLVTRDFDGSQSCTLIFIVSRKNARSY